MWRAAFIALVVAATPAAAQAPSADLPVTRGTPAEIAAAEPDAWTLARPDTIVAANTRIACPAALEGIQLSGVRHDRNTSECIFAPQSVRHGVWLVSYAGPSQEIRTVFSGVYEELTSMPEMELQPVERRTEGACDIEVHRLRNLSGGFWVITYDVYGHDLFHQIRSFYYDEAERTRVETMADTLLALSLTQICGGIS